MKTISKLLHFLAGAVCFFCGLIQKNTAPMYAVLDAVIGVLMMIPLLYEVNHYER